MNFFWVVTLFHAESVSSDLSSLEALAVNDFETSGIEEYSLSEAEVDELLGERSYSGGDLPESVLDEVDAAVKRGPRTVRFFFEEESNARGFYDEIHSRVLGESQIEKFPVEDWNAEWKKHYAPIIVNDQLAVIPAWQKENLPKTKELIAINPGMGFGTGSHETTFLCLKLFTEKVKAPVRTCLDFGSGSGILGLAVLKFYPDAEVDLYDIDPEANENARQNAEINNLSGHRFRLLLPEVRRELKSGYDVVFANILENVLRLEKDFLISRVNPGGSLILSGLLRHQAPGIRAEYSRELEFVEVLEKGDWCALLFRRKP